MLRVRPDRAPPGSTLAAPIYHPQQRGTVLLATGTKLEAGTLDRLARFGCESIWIKIDKLKPIEEFHSDDIRAARERLAADLDSAFRSLVRSKSPEFNADAVRPSVERLIAAVGARPNAGLLIHELSLTKPGLVRHCANVAYLSALLGQRLDFYLIRERPKLPASSARDPLPLVMAGALHDIGMLAVPPQVRERVRQSGDEEDTEWRVHAGIGFAMLKGRVDPAIATAVLNHHQAFDGSGFPPKRGGHGETIPLAGSGAGSSPLSSSSRSFTRSGCASSNAARASGSSGARSRNSMPCFSLSRSSSSQHGSGSADQRPVSRTRICRTGFLSLPRPWRRRASFSTAASASSARSRR